MVDHKFCIVQEWLTSVMDNLKLQSSLKSVFVFEVERIGDRWVTSLHTKHESLALTLFMEETLKAGLHFPNWKGLILEDMMSNVHCRSINLWDLCCLELRGFKFQHEGGWAWNPIVQGWKTVCGHCKGNTEEPEDFTSQQGQILKNPRISLLDKNNYWRTQGFHFSTRAILKNPRISLLNNCNTEEPEDFTSQQGQYWRTRGFHFSTTAILKNPRISLLYKGNTEEPEDFTSGQGQLLKNLRISHLDKSNTQEPKDFSSGWSNKCIWSRVREGSAGDSWKVDGEPHHCLPTIWSADLIAVIEHGVVAETGRKLQSH